LCTAAECGFQLYVALYSDDVTTMNYWHQVVLDNSQSLN